MLIRITNKCTMRCSHCFIDKSGPDGEHMTDETFRSTLRFAAKIGSFNLMISGGEPTEHPNLKWFLVLLEIIKSEVPINILLASNGLWATSPERRDEIEGLLRVAVDQVQITNDDRYYPTSLKDHRHLFERSPYLYIDRIESVIRCRRADENMIETSKFYPTCTNLKANVRRRQMLSLCSSAEALANVVHSIELAGRICTPSVDVDGTIRLGEMDTCTAVGHVDDPLEVIGSNVIKAARCNKCGLEDNLRQEVARVTGVKV